MKTLATILAHARALLADPDRWARTVFAEDAQGEPCYAHEPQAVKWAILGAIYHDLDFPWESMHLHNQLIDRVGEAVKKSRYPNHGIFHFEWYATHAELLALLDSVEV